MKIDIVGLELKTLYTVDVPIRTPYVYGVESAKDIFVETIGRKNVESAAVLCLDNCNKIIHFSIISIGSIANVRVQLAELFKVALLSNAVKIIVAHNHPSNVLTITPSDIAMTKNIGTLAKLFDMELIDSIVVSRSGEFISIREEISQPKEPNYDS